MNQSEREVLVGEFLDQPFDQQHSAEHVGSRCQDSAADFDDIITSFYSLLAAVYNVNHYDCSCSECACGNHTSPADLFLANQIKEPAEQEGDHKLYQHQHNAHQSVCENLLQDSFSFWIHKPSLLYIR